MMRNVVGFTLLSLVLSLPSAASADPRDDAVARVDEAVSLLRDEGGQALKQIGETHGRFHDGAAYVFVYDRDVVIRAHPVKPALVGRSFAGKPDVRGFRFRDAIVENTLREGESWTDYHYQKPGESGMHLKTTFCRKATVDGEDFAVCSGVYTGS
jgi:signal transduction histidine kinase